MLAFLYDKPQPCSRCFASSGSSAEACRLKPGMASRLTLLTVGSCSLRVFCLRCACCVGMVSLLASFASCGRVVLPLLVVVSDEADPFTMFLRAVVMVSPRRLGTLLPDISWPVQRFKLNYIVVPGVTTAWRLGRIAQQTRPCR